ncbi:Hypothetical predicted protein [Cloeon dipterum]|uniref:Uncharacterized protein n=1 Tax=Cloeon dipterum TaxID=197152 RepID=A0A8S1DST5_9INSE|nr:Hypothetical predicted protein [Cloeon dipterum]
MKFFKTLFSFRTRSTEDELQLITRKRLQNLRLRSLGLQQLAVREISKQLTFYLTHPDELEKLTSLPGVLRDKILQVLMKKRCLHEQGEKREFKNLKAIFPLLLSPRTRYIELNGILSFCPGRFKDHKIVKVTQCLCTRNLPNLEVVQYDPNEMKWMISRCFDNRYHGLDFPGASDLRNICVDPEEYSAEEVKAMPNLFPKVTCLMVKTVKNAFLAENLLQKYDNIRQIKLFSPYPRSDTIEKYLINYEQKLQSLYLEHELEFVTVDMELISKSCPKLEKLSLIKTRLITRFKLRPSNEELFAELKELEFEVPYRRYITVDDVHSMMVLSTILSAPKLEKVKLEARIFNTNDNDLCTLNSLIREKKILKNLHTLHVYYEFPIQRVLANFLRSACAFLPKLTDFKYGKVSKSSNLYENPLFASIQPAPLGDVDESVFKMIGVFATER